MRRARRRPEAADAAEGRRRIRAAGTTSARPGGGGAAAQLSRGAPTSLPGPPEAAPLTTTRAEAARRARRQCAIAERPWRLDITGQSCWGCGTGAVDPRVLPTVRVASGQGTEAATGFGGLGGATAAKRGRRGGIRWCCLEVTVHH